MSCLPRKCRCGDFEQRRLGPFLTHYNRVRGTDYVFERRLDATGPKPQPEAAYKDSRTGHELVIERKSLIWPPDFAQLHTTSHAIAAMIDSQLNSVLDPQRAYRLTLQDDVHGSPDEILDYAASVTRAIAKRIDSVHRGKRLRASWPNREWQFCEEALYERDFTEPSTGLIVVFETHQSELDYGEVSDRFIAEWQRLLAAAERKFNSHESATRVLVIDPYADVMWSTDATWQTLITSAPIPSNIDEIWMSMHATITEVNCGWAHKQLWPSLFQVHYELCHDPSAA